MLKKKKTKNIKQKQAGTGTCAETCLFPSFHETWLLAPLGYTEAAPAATAVAAITPSQGTLMAEPRYPWCPPP